MIDQFEKLAAAGILARMEKRAVIGKAVEGIRRGIGSLASGTYRTIGAGTAGAAKELRKHGPIGHVLGAGVRAAPWIGGAALAEHALGNPVGNVMSDQYRAFQARQAQHQAVYDPQTGRFY